VRYHAHVASALITIDQDAPNPSPTGIPGQARDDLLIAVPVTYRNADDTDVSRWVWRLKDKPIGSTVVLSSITAPKVMFTPDVYGSYRVELAVNDGKGGERDIRIGGVRDQFGRLYAAAGQKASEANYLVSGSPNQVNWAKEAELILRSIGVPQLLNAAQSEALAVAASVIFSVGGIGLPAPGTSVAYDFVDLTLGANLGPAPTVSGETFVPVLGFSGLASICVGTFDLDTSGAAVGDLWGFILIGPTGPQLLAQITIV